MKQFCILMLFFGLLINGFSQEVLKSPGQRLKINLDKPGESVSFSVFLDDEKMVTVTDVNLLFDGTSVFEGSKFKTTTSEVSQMVKPEVALKSKQIKDEYNQLRLNFRNGVTIEFRAYNDGVAYRFVTANDKEVKVNETVNFAFGKDVKLWVSPGKTFQANYERNYSITDIPGFPDSTTTYLPILADVNNGNKVLISETDIFDYPHMFLEKSSTGNGLSAVFPKYPLEVELSRDRISDIKKEAGYIAATNSKRSFPWRFLVISDTDADLVKTNLAYLLSRPNQLDDVSWIKPGRVAWDWWNANNVYGVDFVSGKNTATYKYYIDFAARHGLEYALLDGGWAISHMDITQANPDIDIHELIAYGKSKNVGLILWTGWLTLHNNMQVLELYKEWGIAGIKVDFMDRSDQWMVNYYEAVAKEAAKNHLLVDFHGAFKPAGLHRAYPNVVTYEAVKGLEYNKWSKEVTPTHNVTIPFIRMVCGPMDYTLGSLRNFQPENFNPVFQRPGSMGTRCHQLAQFMVYESGIQMFSDSPSAYYREPAIVNFLAKIPVEWDELKVIDAKVGEYIIVARRSGNKWFIGGMTNEQERTLLLDLSFLDTETYQATIMQDGMNANRFAEDYLKINEEVSSDTKLSLNLAPGGGFAIILDCSCDSKEQ